MFHELLLALAGHPGNVFHVSKETGLFEVVPDLPFVYPSEVHLMNRIGRLGTYYLQLCGFIAEQNAATLCLLPPTADKPNKGGGLYHRALACGMDQVLDTYRYSLTRLEKKCVAEPSLPLSFMQHELEQFQLLLPSLDSCVAHILRHKLHGCQILGHLHEQWTSCGVPTVKVAYERILAVCHRVLYKQLSAWMLHGLLDDKHEEFFVEKADSTIVEAKTTVAEPSQSGDEDVWAAPQIDKGGRGRFAPFQLRHSLVPPYIPLRVVEKVLFVGEAVQMFQSRPQKHSDKTVVANIETGSTLRADQFRFNQALTDLQCRPQFQLRDFETTINAVRDCVAEHLWRLLVEESGLVQHLLALKSIYLLGRGELFLAFVDLANPFMRLPPAPTTQHDVNMAFQQAVTRVGMENDKLVRQFELTVATPLRDSGKKTVPARAEPGGPGAWRTLGLRHTASWPHHILFTPAVLERYNALFKFLLALRRAQMGLQQCWALLMQYRNRTGELMGVWQLRMHMGFIVDNLQYYVQVDVLETQLSLLLERIESTHDFESIQHAHDTYLATLHSHLFLHLPSVSQCLHEIMELCGAFTALLHSCKELHLTEEEKGEVERIGKAFRRQTSLFFKIVSGVKSHHSAPHLAQLLLRLDYNKHFSTRNPLASADRPAPPTQP